MEFPTVNDSVTPAKSLPWCHGLSEAEISARIEAAIDVALVSYARGLRRDTAASYAPAPAPAPQRRQRKRSLTKVCEVARKAGAGRVIIDGIAIELSPAAAVSAESNGNEFDEWMARHASPTKGH
jgi:hypothetical protein